MSDVDCRTCGACCVSSQDTSHGWADCTIDDVKRMSRRVRSKLVSIRGGGWQFNDRWHATPTEWRDDVGAVCGFLRGTPGRRVSCGIYETRPDVCRSFRPGSRRCIEARKEILP